MNDELKEKLTFSVFIKGTEPSAVYMDRVYTQLVLVDFANGIQEYIFDDVMLCTPEMFGKTKKIVLVMLVLSLERMETLEKGVESSLNLLGDYSGPNLEINGCIEEIIIPDDPRNAERRHDAIVDFGIGKILIDINKKYFHLQLKKGDYVHVDGRVDLKDIQQI